MQEFKPNENACLEVGFINDFLERFTKNLASIFYVQSFMELTIATFEMLWIMLDVVFIIIIIVFILIVIELTHSNIILGKKKDILSKSNHNQQL